MKLVMVTTSQSHWDGLAGNTAMFSEAVVQPAILNSLPTGFIDTTFIKKNPQTRRFEKAWRGKAGKFKQINKQDKNYLSFEIIELKKINCPEILRTKPVGCYILTESIEPVHVAPKRPLAQLPQLKDSREKTIEIDVAKQDIIEDALEAGILNFSNVEANTIIKEEPAISIENGFYPESARQQTAPKTQEIHTPELRAEKPIINAVPDFLSNILQTNDPVDFERYCFQLLRVLGIHDIHRPANHAGSDAYGYFKFNTLSVVYTTTLVPGVVQDNRMITEHYLNLLKKDKIQFATTSYTLKDTQKQVWIICRAEDKQLLRTEDGIKLKLVSVQHLIDLYHQRLNEESVNADVMWEKMKNL